MREITSELGNSKKENGAFNVSRPSYNEVAFHEDHPKIDKEITTVKQIATKWVKRKTQCSARR